MTMFDLTGKVAVVTGGGSGLGAASAAALARHGATVVVLDRDQDAAEETALRLGHDSFGLTCDVSDPGQVQAAFTAVAQRCGYVSVLHNNAGVSFNGRGDAPPDELELDMWTHILSINLTGTFLCTKFALPLMTATGRGGSVINMASIAGPLVGTRNTAYAASKGGIVAMTKSLAVTHGPVGIRANAICPGSMNTQMAAHVKATPEEYQRFVADVPLGRMGEPSDLEGLVVYLASDESSFFTGNIMTLDGALTLV
jgi:NAD(P)-dependent dehydrogenase (short-subunit alcohol dehydrogenase family)